MFENNGFEKTYHLFFLFAGIKSKFILLIYFIH